MLTLTVDVGWGEESLDLFPFKLLLSTAVLPFQSPEFFLLPLLLSQMQKQNVLPRTSKDSHSMWEEQLKSRSHLEELVAQLDREKAELLEQVSPENSLGA